MLKHKAVVESLLGELLCEMERWILQTGLEGDLGMSSRGECSGFGGYFLEFNSFLTSTHLMSHAPAGSSDK